MLMVLVLFFWDWCLTSPSSISVCLCLSCMAATPVLNSKTSSKSFLPFAAYLPILFISFLLLSFGPFQPESNNPFSVFLPYHYFKSLESNLWNTKFSLPDRGEEEAVNISFITILWHLLRSYVINMIRIDA